MSKFKVGDKVKVVKKGYGDHSEWVAGEFENGWVGPMDGLFEQERTVEKVSNTGVYFFGNEYGFPPAALVLVEEKKEEKHQYKEGDKVIFLKTEEGNEEYDNENFTIGKEYVLLYQDGLWPDHVKVIGDESVVAYARKDQVKLVQEEEAEEIKVNLFKVGDKVRLVHPELAEAVNAPPLAFPSVAIVCELINDSTQSWVRVEGCWYCWPTSSLELVEEEAQPEKKDKYTVEEVLSTLGSLRDMDYSFMVEETKERLLQERDPEWEEFQRLKKKFED